MTKPVALRERAQRDIDEAIAFYLEEAGASVAHDFVEALRAAFALISEHPQAGSPRYGQELGLSGLRSRGLEGFPYVIFFQERDGDLDIWRVLHGQRDIAAWLREP